MEHWLGMWLHGSDFACYLAAIVDRIVFFFCLFFFKGVSAS